jgi:predicted transposase YbfD/YdcC
MQLDPDILAFFDSIPDPRREHLRVHSLGSVLFLSLTAVLCGADSFRAIELFGHEKRKLLEPICPFPEGIPSHDTIGRVLAILDKDALHEVFTDWVNGWRMSLEGKHIAIDGKTLRRSGDTASGTSPLHVVSAFATDYGLVMGQLATDAKSNEITAIPELLKRLRPKGAVITIDAMGCQKEIAAQIREQKADYILALKGNQGTLHRDVEEFFEAHREADASFLKEPDFAAQSCETSEKGHGRDEWRRVVATGDLCPLLRERAAEWPGMRSVIMVERRAKSGDKYREDKAFYISSLEPDARRHGECIRAHWGIENTLHWTLDVTFDEDRSRARATRNAAENFSTLRHITLNLIKKNKEPGMSIKGARLKAGWTESYMMRLIAGHLTAPQNG